MTTCGYVRYQGFRDYPCLKRASHDVEIAPKGTRLPRRTHVPLCTLHMNRERAGKNEWTLIITTDCQCLTCRQAAIRLDSPYGRVRVEA